MKRGTSRGAAAIIFLLAGCGDDQPGTINQTAGEAGSASLFRVAAMAVPAEIGCQSVSSHYPWGKGEARTWTPHAAGEPIEPRVSPGSVYGPPFVARLIQSYGHDYGEARRTAIFEMEDGCRRQFRTESLSTADNAMIDAEIAKHVSPPDPATYDIEYQPGLTSPELVASGELNVFATQHFAFWYGNGRDDTYDFPRVAAQQGRTVDQVIRETAEWAELQWRIQRDVIRSPMPFANTASKKKLSVYLCGTGRPNANGDRTECGAGGGERMNISAWALGKGTHVFPHEFTHMIQYYSGGFREPDTVGPIWETGAEWAAFMVSPSYDDTTNYRNNLEYGPLFSGSRYEAHPFMNFLSETDRTRNLVWSVWKPSPRDGAWSVPAKDFLPTLIAEGQKTGAYPKGFVTFADDMGWYGARLVAMDFLYQRTWLDGLRPSRTTHFLGHLYTPLARSTADATVFLPPVERSLRQWGTHLVPLTATGGEVTVTLTGATIAKSAAWRFAIVAVKAGDIPVYSQLGKVEALGQGATSLRVPAGARLYLAVTATPYRYESLGWQPPGQPGRGTVYPYTVKIEGATPRTGPVRSCDLESDPGNTGTTNYWRNNYQFEWSPC